MTNYEKETLHNIRRMAERGKTFAYNNKNDEYIDMFQHILDELERVGITNNDNKNNSSV